MKQGRVQFGSMTALVALAVVVSLGSVTDVQAGAVLAQMRPEARAQVAAEREAMAQFLSRLSEAVRLLQDHDQPDQAALPADAPTYKDLLARTATMAVIAEDDVPPPAILHAHLIDLPPPASMR